MKSFLTLFILALSALAGARQPNIVMIVGDDVGYGDPGCYGSESNPTPHIDSLAKRGIRFTDYHTAGAMCSPTRASLLTGRYPQRFGSEFDGALSQNSEHPTGLPLAAITIAEILKDRGYATACFGKWHLGYAAPLIPTRQGVDEFRGLLSGDGDHHTHIDRSGNEDWYTNETITMEEGYTSDLLTRYSVDFIRKHRDDPFFLYLPHLAIHFPWQGPSDPPHRQKGVDYKDEKWGIIPDPTNVSPHVQAMLESLDDSVGAVIRTLRELRLEEETLIVFTSDNGGYIEYGERFQNISSNGIYRGQKTDVYEGGHRVPLIVSWANHIEPGVSDALVHSNDWLATLMELSDAESPQEEHDGTSLLPLLLRGEDLPGRTLFWRTRTAKAVRRGPWKLCLTGRKTELFQLEKDPGETPNRASEFPDLVHDLSGAWSTWDTDVNRSAETFEK
jgi:arylsulfatase A